MGRLMAPRRALEHIYLLRRPKGKVMTPREFLESVVRPNVEEFGRHCGDFRCAYNAIASVDALAAHLYFWAIEHSRSAVDSAADDSAYRAELATRNQDFKLLRDIAKAQKHVYLNRNPPPVKRADQVTVRPTGFGEGPYGRGRYGGGDQVVVEITSGQIDFVESIVKGSLGYLEDEMRNLGAYVTTER
jgi:hypothetical protein